MPSVDIMKWIFKMHNIELDIYLIDHVKLPSFLPVNISAMILRCLQQDLFTIHPLPIQALNGIFNQSSNQWRLCLLSSPFPSWFKVQHVAKLLPEMLRLNKITYCLHLSLPTMCFLIELSWLAFISISIFYRYFKGIKIVNVAAACAALVLTLIVRLSPHNCPLIISDLDKNVVSQSRWLLAQTKDHLRQRDREVLVSQCDGANDD